MFDSYSKPMVPQAFAHQYLSFHSEDRHANSYIPYSHAILLHNYSIWSLRGCDACTKDLDMCPGHVMVQHSTHPLLHRWFQSTHEPYWYGSHYFTNTKILIYYKHLGDLLADTTLTALSLNLTWKARMRPFQRRLLIIISLANILNSLVGIVYGVTDILAADLGPHRVLFMLMILHIKVGDSSGTVTNLC